MNGGHRRRADALQSSAEPVDPRAGRDVSTRPGDGTLSRVDAVKDELVRRWDVTSPSATVIGQPEHPDEDVDENLRRLHDEQHPAMAGHSERMHRLEKARITHALCNRLAVTPWERDRALGIVVDLDLTVFGSQRAIPKVALVVIKHVVDDERQRLLGLHDQAWVAEREPRRLAELHVRFDSLTDDPRYEALMEAFGLDVTSVNRLHRTLREQLDEQELRGAVFGRDPFRDPNLPALAGRSDDPVTGTAGADESDSAIGNGDLQGPRDADRDRTDDGTE